jgi:hypothetical protein
MAKQHWFDSSSPGWAEVEALITDMQTASCFGVAEKARMVEIHTRMNADSCLFPRDRNRFMASLAKMLHGGIV